MTTSVAKTSIDNINKTLFAYSRYLSAIGARHLIRLMINFNLKVTLYRAIATGLPWGGLSLIYTDPYTIYLKATH